MTDHDLPTLTGLPSRQGATVFGSVARTTNFQTGSYGVALRGRDEWETGDYVAGEVIGRAGLPWEVETETGRIVEVIEGDILVGAFGRRAATLEAVGDWRDIGDDLRMHGLTRAGVFGFCTSSSIQARSYLVPLRYRGHVVSDGRKVTMRDFCLDHSSAEFDVPVVLLVGTSMDAGKTTAAKAVIRALRRQGLRVGAAKLTGVGRYQDILMMRDAGAEFIVDFVDAGLPSTICGSAEFRDALQRLLAAIADADLDVLVAEAGASPLEPYNGELAIEALRGHVALTLLCASDPYAVLGVMEAFGLTPDLVAGRATSTVAGVALIEKLCGVPALNLLEPGAHPELAELLSEKLGSAAARR